MLIIDFRPFVIVRYPGLDTRKLGHYESFLNENATGLTDHEILEVFQIVKKAFPVSSKIAESWPLNALAKAAGEPSLPTVVVAEQEQDCVHYLIEVLI